MTGKKAWSRTKVSALAFSVLIVAMIIHAYLAIDIQAARQDRSQLLEGVELAETTLERLQRKANDVERIAAARAELEEATALFPEGVSGPATMGALISLAEESGLRVADVSSRPGNRLALGDRVYVSLGIGLDVAGDLYALQAFLTKLEEGALEAVRLEHLEVNALTRLSEEEVPFFIALEEGLRAAMTISVYAKGEAE